MDEKTMERMAEAIDRIEHEISGVHVELRHTRELIEQRMGMAERAIQDHETRLRDATNGVTQFRLWSSLSNGGSALMSLTALIRSFFS